MFFLALFLYNDLRNKNKKHCKLLKDATYKGNWTHCRHVGYSGIICKRIGHIDMKLKINGAAITKARSL